MDKIGENLQKVVAFLTSTDRARSDQFPIENQAGFDKFRNTLTAFEIANARVIFDLELRPPQDGYTNLCRVLYLIEILKQWIARDTSTVEEDDESDGLLDRSD